ncbi:MAG: major capsid protein [Microvirus sp.]|nr:MAG: major capsid protein [Microvirus sp.]
MSQYTFNKTPRVKIPRVRLRRPQSVKTTISAGELVPFYVDEVIPGDTFQLSSTAVCRMNALRASVMDDAYFDMYYFFVPNRLVWTEWTTLMGENKNSAWEEPITEEVPQIKYVSASRKPMDLADYMGLPITGTTGAVDITVNMLPFRAYSLIWNEWFRDQNLQAPIHIDTSSTDLTINTSGNWSVASPYVACAPVNKLHDYFTSALPAPQKGDTVLLPLNGQAPVVTQNAIHSISTTPVTYQSTGNVNISAGEPHFIGITAGSTPILSAPSQAFRIPTTTFGPPSVVNPVPNNLYADLSTSTASSINDLRFAFALQKLYERDARSGTRYTEVIQSHFGVSNPDSRLQRPEYLGGKRQSVNNYQVTQTSSTDNVSPQANIAAFSHTVSHSGHFVKSFTEHGFVIGVCCLRTRQTYSQGIEKFWTRKNRIDYYSPEFANIGEQPIYTTEIYYSAPKANVFGYQEAWADYRYKPNRVSGLMRPRTTNSIAVWNYAEANTTMPTLSDAFIRQGATEVDRTLSISKATAGYQMFVDFYIENISTRCMPIYSVPGLIDHH